MKLLSAVLSAALVVAAAATIYVAVNPPPGERFTEFYLLGPSGKAAGYPTNLTVGEPATVIVGIVNHEYEDASYKIEVKTGGKTAARIDGIELRHNDVWEENYTFTIEEPYENMKIEFLLHKDGIEETYRNLHLWITVTPKE